MKALMRNPRTATPTLAVFIALVLTFAVPPLSSVVAAGSSSGSMSSPPASCDSQFTASGAISPGGTVTGTLSLDNGCRFSGTVTLALNGAKLQKLPDSNGAVRTTVKILSLTEADLDDPVRAPITQGKNTVSATGPALRPDGSTTTGTVLADFTVVPGTTVTTVKPGPTVPATPVSVVQTTTGGNLARTGVNLLAMALLALIAIALGAFTIASERAVPLAAGAGSDGIVVTVPLLEKVRGWDIEALTLTAVAYVLGPPPGKHMKKGGPRGLIPTLRGR
jgi:hypothetical protein